LWRVQLARVAWSVTTRPSFTKRLTLVLKAVCGLVDPSSPTYITEKMLKVMSQMASKRMGDVFGDESLAGVRVAVDLDATASGSLVPEAVPVTAVPAQKDGGKDNTAVLATPPVSLSSASDTLSPV
jgi:hypothetical protein